MRGPSHVQPEGNGPDHTAHTKRTNTESNERGDLERRGERREKRGRKHERGRGQRRRARAATPHKEEELEPRHRSTPWSHKISWTGIQGAPTNVSTIGGLDRGISRGRTYRKKGKKARSRHTRWASVGTL